MDSDDAASDSEDEAQGSDSDHDMPAGVADDPFFQHEADPFDDPFFKDGPGGVGLDGTGKPKSKKKEKRKGDERKQGGDDDLEADRRRRAELEMLLMDEGDLLKAGSRANAAGNSKTAAGDGAAGSKLSKKERMRLKKERARKDRQGESDDEDHDAAVGAGFKVNLDDPRFKDLYASADYALDPTDPRFAKAGPAAAVLAKEVAIRRSKAPAKRASNGSKEDKDAGEGANGGAGNSKADLKLMVASLKRKAATAEAGSGKAQGKAQAQGGKPAKMRKGGKGG